MRFREPQLPDMGPASYVRFTYLYAQQHTNRDEISLGLQTEALEALGLADMNSGHHSLLYVDADSKNRDFMHLYLVPRPLFRILTKAFQSLLIHTGTLLLFLLALIWQRIG